MSGIYLTPNQIGTVYQKKEVTIKDGDKTITLQFVSEKEGKIHHNKETTYNSEYERESVITLKSKKTGRLYVGPVFEGGSDPDDMQINSGSHFSKK